MKQMRRRWVGDCEGYYVLYNLVKDREYGYLLKGMVIKRIGITPVKTKA